jgi:dipeptidase D
LYVGCAGGVDTTATFDFQPVAVEEGDIAYKICLTGCKGGH